MKIKNFTKILILLFSVIFITGQTAVFAGQAKPDIPAMIESLNEHSLAVYKNGKVTYQDEGGIKPLLIKIEKKELKNAVVVDRVIGKAAALLMVYGKVKEVHTKVIAKQAIEVFKKHKIKYSAIETVDYIQNKTKTGLCPMEQKCAGTDSPKEAYKIFKSL